MRWSATAGFALLLASGVAVLGQQPPAAQQQQPAGQQQPAAQQPPAAPQVLQQSAPPPGLAAPVRQASQTAPDSSDGLFSLELFYLESLAHPDVVTGKSYQTPQTPGNLSFSRKSAPSGGVVLGFPAGKGNTLRFTYFRVQGKESTTAPTDINLFSTGYNAGTFITTKYTLQNVKLTYDYLVYPFPPEDAKFRVRVLFEAQYTLIGAHYNAPYEPTTNSAGNAVVTTAQASQGFIYPAFGAAVERALSKHFRVEAKATGFALPHHATIYDAEALAAYRHGHAEVLFHANAFHFRTSVQQNQYLFATIPSAGLGVRWYLQ